MFIQGVAQGSFRILSLNLTSQDNTEGILPRKEYTLHLLSSLITLFMTLNLDTWPKASIFTPALGPANIRTECDQNLSLDRDIFRRKTQSELFLRI